MAPEPAALTQSPYSANAITWVLRALFFLAPVFAQYITKRIRLGLQRKDRELVLHGHESGRLVRYAHGEYVEVHTPLDEQERWLRVNYDAPAPLTIAPKTDARGVKRKGYASDKRWQGLSRFFYEDRVSPVTPAEVAAAHSHGEHDQIDGSERQAVEAGAGTTSREH